MNILDTHRTFVVSCDDDLVVKFYKISKCGNFGFYVHPTSGERRVHRKNVRVFGMDNDVGEPGHVANPYSETIPVGSPVESLPSRQNLPRTYEDSLVRIAAEYTDVQCELRALAVESELKQRTAANKSLIRAIKAGVNYPSTNEVRSEVIYAACCAVGFVLASVMFALSDYI